MHQQDEPGMSGLQQDGVSWGDDYFCRDGAQSAVVSSHTLSNHIYIRLPLFVSLVAQNWISAWCPMDVEYCLPH